MNSQDVGSATLAEKTEFEAQAARDVDHAIPDGPAGEIGLDDLVDYQPVPPRRVAPIVVRYQRVGRGRALPYFINEVSRE
jgi:hypothetical protein